ncbi:MAG: molybdate ABC transporter permease subunit [Eubacteriales bacterium]|nr:molybdate ABC transporter permease subunit [Eubacteriales bacterium]
MDRWEWSPVLTSLKTAVTGIFFTFFLGLLLVRLIRSIRWRPLYLILDGILTLPMVLPPTVIGFFLLRLLGVNSFIGQLFLDFFDFRIVFSWASTVIAAVTLSLPLMYKSTMGAMEQVDENLVYAARTLGFSERRIFWRILVPNAVSGIAAATILAFARGLGEYGATSMIAGNILGQTRTLPIAVAVTTSAGQDDQANFYAAVIVVVSLILLTVMNYVTLRMSRRGGRQ